MRWAAWLVFLTGAFPLWRAWQGSRATSLGQAVGWALAAWVAWGGMMLVTLLGGEAVEDSLTAYLALCLTGCAGVAVLGARRPGVGAWNFVVLGLLAVMLLPLAENLLAQRLTLDGLRIFFLSATVAVGVLNYLPTRLAAAALLLGLALTLQIVVLLDQRGDEITVSWWLLALVPWTGLICWRARPAPAAEFDRVWITFRDRFGFLWGQRMREQFNRAAANAGWPVVLRWQGLRLLPGTSRPGVETQAEIVNALRALLKRFGGPEGRQ